MENKSSYSKERREWLKAHHICVRCGNEDAEPNSTFCLECLEKRRVWGRKYYKKNKNKLDKNNRQCHKRLYWERKKQGICTKCGKRKVCRKSTIYCIDCYIKCNRAYREKNPGISRSERPAYGLCYRCGKQGLYSDKLCRSCFEDSSNFMKALHEKATPAMLDAKENYKNYFKAIFGQV